MVGGFGRKTGKLIILLMAHLDNKKKLNNYERLVMDEIKAWREKLIEAWLYRFFVNFLPLEQYLLAQVLAGRKNWQVKTLWTARFREFCLFRKASIFCDKPAANTGIFLVPCSGMRGLCGEV